MLFVLDLRLLSRPAIRRASVRYKIFHTKMKILISMPYLRGPKNWRCLLDQLIGFFHMQFVIKPYGAPSNSPTMILHKRLGKCNGSSRFSKNIKHGFIKNGSWRKQKSRIQEKMIRDCLRIRCPKQAHENAKTMMTKKCVRSK